MTWCIAGFGVVILEDEMEILMERNDDSESERCLLRLSSLQGGAGRSEVAEMADNIPPPLGVGVTLSLIHI